MGCPSCGVENRPGARFCNGCGAALAPTCASCGQGNPPGSRFCDACGQALTTRAALSPQAPPSAPPTAPSLAPTPPSADGATLEGERKHVTILFADVVGSTALIQGRDDEEAQKLLDGAVERMVDAVHRYGGTVSRRMGDGLMAMFGAPVAHEDHALRASFAALAMLEAARAYADEARATHGAALQTRVGLNSGGVIVRLISNDRHLDYTAMGETVHLASRMEQLATPGTALVSQATRALIEGLVEVRGRGIMEVKGIEPPIEVCELVGAGAARTRLQATSVRGLTPFVGREDERVAIDRALSRAQAGQGQVLALVAEAGVGKSRLVWEATRSDRASAVRVLQTGAVSYGQTTTWLPIIDLLRTYFQIDNRDDHAAMRDKVTAGLVALDSALEPSSPPLLALLDVPVDPSVSAAEAAWAQRDPAQRRRATLDAVRQLLLRESHRQPVLLVFEDLHWIDSETQALLDALVESLPTARILLLVNYRPEYGHTWGSKTYYTQLRVDPLGGEMAEEFLSALLGSDDSVQPLKSLLINRTEGTPLYLEESVRALVETDALDGERGAYRLTGPVDEIRVPATVQTVLSARIDRLPAEDKGLIQTAAVIGKDIPFVLLRGIAERPEAELQASLSRLQAAELLYQTTLFPEPEYTFKHALTHEVAYGSLLNERRKSLHARIVAAIEAEYGDRLDEHVERLAHHAFRAEAWSRALTYYRQAASRALGRSAAREEIAFLEQGQISLDHLPQSRTALEQGIALQLGLRRAALVTADTARALTAAQEAERLAIVLDDPHELVRVSSALAYTARALGDSERALQAGQRAVQAAATMHDTRLQATTYVVLGRIHHDRGEFQRALDCFGRSQRLLHDDDMEGPSLSAPIVETLSMLTWSSYETGAFTEAATYGAEAIRIAESLTHPVSLGVATSNVGWACLMRGELGRSRQLLERQFEIAQRDDIPMAFCWSASGLGMVLALTGQIAEGVSLLEQVETLAQSRQMHDGRARWLYTLADAYRLAGHADAAIDRATRASRLATDRSERPYLAYSTRVLAESAAQGKSTDAIHAESHFCDALALAQELGMRPLQAHCHLDLGKLYRRAGRHDEARAELATAVAMLRAMGMTFWLPEAESELAAAAH